MYNRNVIIPLAISAAVATLFLTRTVWALHRFKYRPADHASADLPSVSVCIAARNETHALAQCLERVLKSDYPKLEILVLDDSSDDDTSLIIKSFAGAGVRFIAGKELPSGWLGKNHAYQTLIDEASGDYVLFLDVDTSVAPTTVTQLVDQLLAHRKSMLSVLPRREDAFRASAVFGTMRYHWELLLGTKDSPPAASALWLVRRDRLADAGIGLAHYGLSVRPERHLARQLQRDKDYYYLIGTEKLGVGFEKRWRSQAETAFRLYFPMSGRSLWKWAIAVLIVLALLAPLPVILSWRWTAFELTWAIVDLVIISAAIRLYTARTHGTGRSLRMIVWPALLVQELTLLVISFLKYRFGTVTWKGRAVHAQPSNRAHLEIGE